MLDNPKKQFIVLILIGIICFFAYSFLNSGKLKPIFSWPDETANYFFTKNYIENSSFSVAEPLNAIAGDLIKPRSFNIYNHNLVPVSFLGLPLIYGLIGKIFSLKIILYLTPLLAIIAVLFFYKIILQIFEPRVAFLCSLLMFINPAWWYYASFSLLPNVVFITFLIIGFYYLIRIDKNKPQNNYLSLIIGSFFIGLALIVRTNEIVWIGAVLLFLTIYFKEKIKWSYILLFILTVIIVFLPIFYYNHLTYGSYFSSGYLKINLGNDLASQLPTEFNQNKTASNITSLIQTIFLPFGFHPIQILKVIYHYFILLFWWLLMPAIIGLYFLLKNYRQKKNIAFFTILGIITVYLLIYYGSWLFEDKLTIALSTLGISYVRYFLPIYILILPLVAVFIFSLIELIKNNNWKKITFEVLFLAIVFLSIQMVWNQGYDNLPQIKENIANYTAINQKITELTPANSIIVSQRADKIFFPDRKVISQWGDSDYIYFFALLKAGYQLYYYAYEDDVYINDLTSKLDKAGMIIDNQVKINETDRLFEIRLK